jgi:hypothetical protein
MPKPDTMFCLVSFHAFAVAYAVSELRLPRLGGGASLNSASIFKTKML